MGHLKGLPALFLFSSSRVVSNKKGDNDLTAYISISERGNEVRF